jgi:hypothetical protein
MTVLAPSRATTEVANMIVNECEVKKGVLRRVKGGVQQCWQENGIMEMVEVRVQESVVLRTCTAGGFGLPNKNAAKLSRIGYFASLDRGRGG